MVEGGNSIPTTNLPQMREAVRWKFFYYLFLQASLEESLYNIRYEIIRGSTIKSRENRNLRITLLNHTTKIFQHSLRTVIY